MIDLLERTARYFTVGKRAEHLISQWVTSVMIVVHWGLGLAIIIGGKQRFSVPSYQPLINLSGGHVWLWGVQIIASAVLMMVPLKWPSIIGLWIGMSWMIVWCGLFFVSVIEYPTSTATAAVAYAGFAMINAALLTARVIEKPVPRA